MEEENKVLSKAFGGGGWIAASQILVDDQFNQVVKKVAIVVYIKYFL